MLIDDLITLPANTIWNNLENKIIFKNTFQSTYLFNYTYLSELFNFD